MTPSVRELRRRWKPHKERLAALRSDHPTAVRFHRACSWLSEAEKLEFPAQSDLVLVHQWIALNALYGQWDAGSLEPAADRRSWKAFLDRLLAIDRSGHVAGVLQEHKPLVLAILEDDYLNRRFWQRPGQPNAGRRNQARQRALGWYVEGRWIMVAEQLLERVYLLRCQLVHGAATLGSKLNRTSLRRCATMMSHFLPAVLEVWIDHGALEDWGRMCYPPLHAGHGAKTARPAT